MRHDDKSIHLVQMELKSAWTRRQISAHRYFNHISNNYCTSWYEWNGLHSAFRRILSQPIFAKFRNLFDKFLLNFKLFLQSNQCSSICSFFLFFVVVVANFDLKALPGLPKSCSILSNIIRLECQASWPNHRNLIVKLPSGSTAYHISYRVGLSPWGMGF